VSGDVDRLSEEVDRRLASNEDVFRDVNEGIVRGQWPGDPEAIGFRCECARLGCNMLVALTLGEYEAVRANPRRFVIVRGHEVPEVEVVVEEHDRYGVVEKVGAAGDEAERQDPRS
jgi:hypothetical protein